jgi:poly-gamma-glutamate synthesis protein (capsule biosynthesis protein)
MMKLFFRLSMILGALLVSPSCSGLYPGSATQSTSLQKVTTPIVSTRVLEQTTPVVETATAEVNDKNNPIEITVWLDPKLPTSVRNVFGESNLKVVTRRSEADFHLIVDINSDAKNRTDWFYVIGARFPTVQDTIPLEDVMAIWRGEVEKRMLLIDPETEVVFTAVWGEAMGTAVQIHPREELLDLAWENSSAIAIIPFDEIEPRWKILQVDGFDPLDPGMDERDYPLRVSFVLEKFTNLKQDPGEIEIPSSNRDKEKIVTLMMTGVTALVRGTARVMNEKGVFYPAKDIGALLSSADLTHISNEVSFDPECTPERAASTDGRFCSAPGYIELLEATGTDIVELTGNHNLDFGQKGYIFSYEEYKKRGWQIYGGGMNQLEASKGVMVEAGDTRLVFLGCNWSGPDFAWASDKSPGAARCDTSYLRSEIQRFRQMGFLPVITFQAVEVEDYMPVPAQRPSEFNMMAEAGAVIVSGSQAHFPQGFKFMGSNLVHYGLGNLFFDQMQPPATRKAFIDRHIFYGDRYLGTQLITITLEEGAKPRLMTENEREIFLRRIFIESYWKRP